MRILRKNMCKSQTHVPGITNQVEIGRSLSLVRLKSNTDGPDWFLTLLPETCRDPAFFHFVAPTLQNMAPKLTMLLSKAERKRKNVQHHV